jgi:hypothetical protein
MAEFAEVWGSAKLEGVIMRQVLSLVAAATLLASAGLANAKGPLTLTDSQLDKVTAGASTDELSSLPAVLLLIGGILAGPLGPLGPLGPHGLLPGATPE